MINSECLIRIYPLKNENISKKCIFKIEKECNFIKTEHKFTFDLEYLFENVEEYYHQTFIENIITNFLNIKDNYEIIYDIDNNNFKSFMTYIKAIYSRKMI